MKQYILIFLAAVVFTAVRSNAQKGMPPKDIVNASVTTNYAQHEDFKESMLSRLNTAPGYTVTIAATGLGKPRMMLVTNDGALYVTRRDQGDVLLLTDKDKDGRFDDMKPVVAGFKGVHGIAVQGKFLYLCSNRELKRYTINPDNTLKDTMAIFTDLPDGGQHGNRTMAFGPDGKLYLSVGSDCNDCNESNPEHATMLVINLDSNSRKIYARGLRNTIGFDWHPQTKELWGADNGTDWRGDEIPPEELNKIIKDGNYGWPLIFGKQQVDPTREDPAGSTKAAYAKTTQPSVMEFPAHSAPINLKFLGNDALVSWHGSWNKTNPDGFKVQRIRFLNGVPTKAEDFLTGFLARDGRSRFGRPAGIAVSGNGSVYVSDDANGVIYKISPK
ncbi:MAG TPA: PQQ-dependent sugar dehydrogenase [Chitinophagaceae bacterium]|jgi:glucose/arabinose dehydrogenase|nr:PQQ-dependent sugar dehydrogenase [Chitinophagaceae bacterium]